MRASDCMPEELSATVGAITCALNCVHEVWRAEPAATAPDDACLMAHVAMAKRDHLLLGVLGALAVEPPSTRADGAIACVESRS